MLYPKDSVTTFRFKIVKSKYEDGDSIYFGVVNNNFANLSQWVGKDAHSWGMQRMNGHLMHNENDTEFNKVRRKHVEGNIVGITVNTATGT